VKASTADAPRTQEQEPSALRVGLLFVGLALLAGQALLFVAATTVPGVKPLAASSYARWDSGNYFSIADTGYEIAHCQNFPNRTAEDWCGNTGWAPLLPLLLRAGRAVGIPFAVTGVIVAHIATALMLWVIWRWFLRQERSRRAFLVLLLVAFFPGSVWNRAVFPMSITILMALLTALFLSRRRWLAAGLCAAIAVLAHSFGVVVVTAAVAYALVDNRRELLVAVRAAVAVGLPGSIAFALWFLHLRAATGLWNAYFLLQDSYDHDSGFPAIVLARRLGGDLKDGEFIRNYAKIARAQEIVLTLLVAATIAVAFRNRERLTRSDWAALVIGLAIWCANLQVGTSPAFWRLAVLCIPLAIVLRHAPVLVLAVAVLALIPLQFELAQGFFDFTLY
jgi:hypothetical protein